MPIADNLGVYITTDENLEQYPELIDNQYFEHLPEAGLIHKLELGDMHASTLKAFYFLVKKNIIQIEKNDFDEFVRIFKVLHTLSDLPLDTEYSDDEIKRDLAHAREIMSRITVNPLALEMLEIPFAGDNFGDRAGLDFLNAMFYHRLDQLGINYHLIFSNHDSEYLQTYEKGLNPNEEGLPFVTRLTVPQAPGQDKSLQNTGILLRRGLIEKQEIDEYMKSILPHYRAIDYSLTSDTKHVEHLSHAGTDLSIVWHMAYYLRVELDHLLNENEKLLLDSIHPLLETLKKIFELSRDNTFASSCLNVKDFSLAVAHAINAVNQIFSHLIISGHTTDLLGPPANVFSYAAPFQFAAWNRNADMLYRPANLAGCSFHYLQGHDPYFQPAYPITNLDFNNAIGRPIADDQFNHHASYPHYFLPNQLSRQQIDAKLQFFNPEEFIFNAEKELKRIHDLLTADCDKTVEATEEKSEEENKQENISAQETHNENSKKRFSNNSDSSAKRIKFFSGPTKMLRRSFSDSSLMNDALTPILELTEARSKLKRNNSL